MNKKEFVEIGKMMFGPEHGWHKRCADNFHVTYMTVYRWSTGRTPVPEKVKKSMLEWYSMLDKRFRG